MSRSVFLSACGDPFTALFVIKLWKERWYDEIDKFYICYNNHCGVPIEVASEFVATVTKEPKVHLIAHPRGIGNGMPITEMVKICDTDLVMLLEDDGFIFEKGAVNECFQKIESDLCDALGSPRGSCGQEIWEASKTRYGLDYSGYGDVGPNFWPCFFFCKRKDLLKTDLDFASKTFQPGVYCKELDYTFKEINHGDTFVWSCMQLRAMGLRFQNIPQHHADPYEIQNKEIQAMNWHPSQKPFNWIHGGSLSASWGGYLSNRVPTATDDSSIQEMETRCAFWTIAADNTPGFDEFKQLYKSGITKLMIDAHLDQRRIDKKINIYKTLMRI